MASGTDRSAARRLVPAALAGGVLVALTVVTFRRHLLDAWTFPWDFVGSYSTTPAFFAASAGHGEWLTWTPFVAGGFPVELSPQAGAYYPFWWLFGALGRPLTLHAVTVVQVAHVALGALGMLVLGRARELRWAWALVAAAAYLFFGGFYGQAEHSDYVRGFAYLPWLLWALTPPPEPRRWTRLLALPALAWLIASGAYPAQVVSFALVGGVYVALGLRDRSPATRRRDAVAAAAALGASVAIATATLLPYLRASMAGELHRVLEPTAAVRAKGSLHILDALGLYLNNFAWTYEGTIAAWAVGIPVLVGLACVGRAVLWRSLPVVVMGALALVLGVVPTIGPIGDAMASLGPLFPSRFPAADYKPAVAIALILLATQGWSDVAGRSVRARRTAPVVAAAVVVGAVVAPSTHALPTRHLWVVVAVAVAAAAAASWRPGGQWALAGVVLVLVVVDGTREVTDYRHESGTVPWRITPAQADVDPARDQFVRRLPALLDAAPVRRPARVGPTAPFDLFPTGTNADASGWVADRYHLTDYGSTITRARYTAEHNPRWSRLLLAPWQAYAWSCRSVGCSFGRIRVPPAPAWRPSAAVRSVSYAAGRITYSVSLTQPALMVENELAVPGWRSDRPGVRIVDARIPLRAWRLPAGRYRFSASYRAPGRELQLAVLGLGLVAWLACPVALRRRAHRLVFGAD